MPPEYKRKYTTKKIMEMTNLDRLQKEAAAKAQELLKEAAAKQNPVADPQPDAGEGAQPAAVPENPAQAAAASAGEPAEEAKVPAPFTMAVSRSSAPQDWTADDIQEGEGKPGLFSGVSVFILLFPTLYLMLIFSLPEKWINALRDSLNEFILYGSFFVLNLLGVPATLDGSVLSGTNFKILLGGDLVGFYSIVLLGAFALLFVSVQKTTAIRKCIIFLSFVPLAVFANITRIVITVGLAVNLGVQSADQYLHGFLESLVYIITILGMIILTLLLRTDDTEP